MATEAKTSPAVPGSTFGPMGNVQGRSFPVRLLRPICIQGKRVEEGTVMPALPPAIACELIGSNKATRDLEPPKSDKKPTGKDHHVQQ